VRGKWTLRECSRCTERNIGWKHILYYQNQNLHKFTDTYLEKPRRELPLAVDETRPITSYGGQVHQLAFSYEDFLSRENLTVTADPSDKDLYFSGNTTDRRDCPSLFFYFGSSPDTTIRSSLRNTSEFGNSAVIKNFIFGEDQVTTLACRQKLQELDVIVTLCLPDLTIDKANSPRTDENSVRSIGSTGRERLSLRSLCTLFTYAPFPPFFCSYHVMVNYEPIRTSLKEPIRTSL
jgi:hypothetical protein